jgi:hypothetical protein
MVKEALRGLFYTLLRDHIQPGVLERLVAETEVCPPPYQFSNQHLADYAYELVWRIAGVQRDGNAEHRWVVEGEDCALYWSDSEDEARKEHSRLWHKGYECSVVFRPLTPEEERMS